MSENKNVLSKFPREYWVSIFYEFVERGAYYGVMSILSVYLVASASDGGLGFSKMQAGAIKGTIQPILYGLPIFCGAIADRFGYRRTLMAAFLLLGAGYLASSRMTSFWGFFMAMIVMSLGAGAFKPVISSTIARVTDEKTSTLGFGIFYWSINLGAFLFPLLVVPAMRDNFGWSYVFVASGIAVLLMIIPNIFVYREPPKPESTKTIVQVFGEAVKVLGDLKFISLLVIYSGFWVLYFQMFDTVLWYITEYASTAPVENGVNRLLSSFVASPSFKLRPEHMTVINAAAIITLQLFVSNATKSTKALPTMITGILFGTVGMGLIAYSAFTVERTAAELGLAGAAELMKTASHPSMTFHAWSLIAGVVLFTLGEMTAHPKFISYVGLIAPKDKVATYMGYSFLYGVIGSGLACLIGPVAYEHFITKNDNPAGMWLFFTCIGIASIAGLAAYNRFIAGKPGAKGEEAGAEKGGEAASEPEQASEPEPRD